MNNQLSAARWRGLVIAIFALVAMSQAAFVLHEIVDQHERSTVCEICTGFAQLGDALVSSVSLTIAVFALIFIPVAASLPDIQRRPAQVRSRSPPSL